MQLQLGVFVGATLFQQFDLQEILKIKTMRQQIQIIIHFLQLKVHRDHKFIIIVKRD